MIDWRSAKPGAVVAIRFLDHCHGGDRPIEFVVYGRLVSKDRKHLTVDSWEYDNRETQHDDNEERFSIVRSTITGLAVLSDDSDLFGGGL